MYNVEHAAELVIYIMALTDNGQWMPMYYVYAIKISGAVGDGVNTLYHG